MLKQEKKNKKLIKILILAILIFFTIVILLTIYLALSNKSQEFTELYFSQPLTIQKEKFLNEPFKESFSVVSHEKSITNYTYEVIFNQTYYQRNFTLLPEGKKTFTIEIIPVNTDVKIDLNVETTIEEKYSLNKKSNIYENNEFNIIINNELLDNSLPVSYNLSLLGYIYHANLNIEELKQKPFTKFSRETTTGEFFESTEENTSIKVEDNNLILDMTKKESYGVVKPTPLTIKLYKNNGENPLEVYFWYKVI